MRVHFTFIHPLCGGLLMFLLAVNPLYADGSTHRIPGIDRQVSYRVPANLTSLSTQQLENMRASHHRDLARLKNTADSARQQAEDNMLKELLAHDLVRLSIADVIPGLIEDYNIEGKFKDTLLGYRSTFTGELMASRATVKTLKDYQSYDFRFAAVYMSMLFSFQEHPEFYKRLKADMVNATTAIGGYRKLLDDSYQGVEKARVEIDQLGSTEDIEKVIAALSEELAKRGYP